MGAAKRICLGVFAGARGVRGEAKVRTFTEKPESIAAYGPLTSKDGQRVFTLEIVRVLKNNLVAVRASGIERRADAEALSGVKLYVARDALPKVGDDEFYVEDLIGLAAVAENGAPAGRVCAVHEFGAGAIIELAEVPNRKDAVMVAFRKEFIPHVDLDAGRLTVVASALLEGAPDEPADHAADPSVNETKRGGPAPALSDDTGEIVSDDIDVDLDAMRAEDS